MTSPPGRLARGFVPYCAAIGLLGGLATWALGGCGLSTAGVATTCKTLAECDDSNPCTLDRCASGACAHAPAPDGEPPEQVLGDCKKARCEGGEAHNDVDDTDVDDYEVCTVDSCSGGKATHDPKPLEGNSCALGSSLGNCQNGACVVSCANGEKCDDGDACTEDSCDLGNGTCLFDPGPLNGKSPPGATDLPGDCVQQVCSNGQVKEMPDDEEVPDDHNDCTADECQSGNKHFSFEKAGKPCSAGECNGRGSCVGCTAPEDCGDADDCSVPTCIARTCGIAYEPAGTALPSDKQTPEDCLELQCDGSGGITSQDADDPEDDGNPCTHDTCAGGDPKHPPEPPGKSCSGGVCSGSGACVECVDDSTCDDPDTCGGGGNANECGCENDPMSVTCSGKCGPLVGNCGQSVNCPLACPPNKTCGGGGVANQCGCSPGHCCDGSTNSGESDTDCGGGGCVLCPGGSDCTSDSNCQSGNCLGGGTCHS